MIADCRTWVKDWLTEMWPPTKKADLATSEEQPPAPQVVPNCVTYINTVEHMVRVATRATNGADVQRLLDGTIDEYPSHSEAVLALCNHGAFYFGGDRGLIDQLVRQSKLCNDKWLEREDYREATINKALEGRTEFYTPRVKSSETSDDEQVTHVIGNADIIRGEDNEEPITIPRTMNEIRKVIADRTGNWPRRVGSALFVHEAPGIVQWLLKSPALYGYLGTVAAPPARFVQKTGCHTRDEVFCELQRTALEYKAIDLLPHEPPIEGHFYACTTPAPGDGKVLSCLLDMFCPAEPVDRDLILAALATIFWGGPGGSRPAFLITSDDGRGAGKSKNAAALAHVAGGLLDFSSNEKIKEIKERILSPEGQTKRVAVLDNVKSFRFSWAELEAIITCPVISGRAMYIGEGQRPNTLTWFVTLNGASLSTDLAQRCVIIKIKRPTYGGTWEEDVAKFIDGHREQIIGDLISFLRSPPRKLQQFSRWGLWDRDILSRLPDPIEAQKVIAERRQVADVEEEESELLEDYVRSQLENLTYDVDRDRVFIPSATMCRWVNFATNEKHGVTAVSRMIGQKITEKKLKRIQHCPNRNAGRGFEWIGDQWDINEYTKYDIESRLSYQVERSH